MRDELRLMILWRSVVVTFEFCGESSICVLRSRRSTFAMMCVRGMVVLGCLGSLHFRAHAIFTSVFGITLPVQDAQC